MSTELPDEAWLTALLGLDGMGPARLQALLDVGDPASAWRQVLAGRIDEWARARIQRSAGRRTDEIVAAWRAQAARIDPTAVWHRHLDAGVHVLRRTAPGFPPALAADPDPPALLYAMGHLEALNQPLVAIVGTRDATRYGFDVARMLGRDLAAAGVGVLSGLALGIDGAAHAGAVEGRTTDAGGRPVGIVGSGLDVVYPARNRRLWQAVAEHGLLLSEYPLGARPQAWRFPARNRLVASLAEVVVVVESQDEGGSMITATLAIERDTPVMAVPGPVTSRVSDGPLELLGTGLHGMVRSAADVLHALGSVAAAVAGAAGPPVGSSPPGDQGPVLEPVHRAVLDALGWQAATLDQLHLRTGLRLLDLSDALSVLEAAGRVDRRGSWYEQRATPADLRPPGPPRPPQARPTRRLA